MKNSKKKIIMVMVNKRILDDIGGRFKAMRQFLIDRGHEVIIVVPSEENLNKFRKEKGGVLSRVLRKTKNANPSFHIDDWLSDEIESQLKSLGPEVVIATDILIAYVLRKDLNCLKIADMANIAFLEQYYRGECQAGIKKIYEIESEVYKQADFLLSRPGLVDFLNNYFPQIYRLVREKIVIVSPGCFRKEKRAVYHYPPKIVYAGGAEQHIQDPALLAYIFNTSGLEVDFCGRQSPDFCFMPKTVRYKGWQETTDFMSNYQFGLVTEARTLLRHYSISTKFPEYFSWGLPVLFPEWMKEGYRYKGCIPYNEDNFAKQIKKHTDKNLWEDLSNQVLEEAKNLTWDKTLIPLAEIIEEA